MPLHPQAVADAYSNRSTKQVVLRGKAGAGARRAGLGGERRSRAKAEARPGMCSCHSRLCAVDPSAALSASARRKRSIPRVMARMSRMHAPDARHVGSDGASHPALRRICACARRAPLPFSVRGSGHGEGLRRRQDRAAAGDARRRLQCILNPVSIRPRRGAGSGGAARPQNSRSSAAHR